MKQMLSILALAGALMTTAPMPAVAADGASTVHPDVAYALAVEPGGVPMSYSSASWPELGMRIDVPMGRAVGTCATGSICAFSTSGLGGTKLSWTTCGSKSTAALSQVGSIGNARSSGTLQARQGATVRASASANSQANVPIAYWPSITNIFC